MSLINKAIEIAKNNPSCFIGYFVPSRLHMADIFCETASGGAFHTERTRDRFVFHNGARIQFGTLENDALCGFLSGAVLTHAFVDAYLWEIDFKHWGYIQSRIRHHTLKDFTDVGVYDKAGKYVWED